MSTIPHDDLTWDGIHRRLPPALRAHISITEVDDGAFFVDALFRRKFGDPPPPMAAGHHVVAFVRAAPAAEAATGAGARVAPVPGAVAPAVVPIAYTFFQRIGEICLVGGMSTDGRAFAHLDPAAREAVASGGGLAYYMLHYGFARFGAAAYFGHVGDARAREVDLRAGFRDTAHQHLMIYTPHPLPDAKRLALIAQAHAIGPF